MLWDSQVLNAIHLSDALDQCSLFITQIMVKLCAFSLALITVSIITLMIIENRALWLARSFALSRYNHRAVIITLKASSFQNGSQIFWCFGVGNWSGDVNIGEYSRRLIVKWKACSQASAISNNCKRKLIERWLHNTDPTPQPHICTIAYHW